MRLTRRGRVLVVLVALFLLLALGFAFGRVSAGNAAGPVAIHTTVVQPGETLWSIAARTAPQKDPRTVVARLRAVNHLGTASVRAGQRLVLPR